MSRVVELVLGAPAAGGGFVARDADGRVIFVRHGISAERVTAVLTEEHARWARADAIEVLDASETRVAAPCPYAGAGACGGCDYQHIAVDSQRAIKGQLLASQLRSIPGIDLLVGVEAAAPATYGLGSRTRVRFGVDDRGRLGMRRHRRHDVVEVERCALGVEAIGRLGLGERQWPGDVEEVEAIALRGAGAATVVSTPRRRGARPGGRQRRGVVLEGPGLAAVQATVVGAARYSVSAGVFWQVHELAPELLVDAVLQGLGLAAGERVLDLYCGAGLFTRAAAVAVGASGAVTGIDASAAAIADAVTNLGDIDWASGVAARVDGRSVARAARGCTHVVLDPPRGGADRGALEALTEASSIRRAVSVSCDPATFARDLGLLVRGGWRIERIRALDLFEMTEHIECVAVLSR